MRLSNIVPMALAFVIAAGGAYLAASAAVGALETNSQREVAFQVRLEGHEWASVQADGLQVVVSGEAPTEAERFKVLSVAGSVVDAARVIDNMSVFDPQGIVAPRFSVEMLRNDAGISLIGLIPAETDRGSMLRRLRARANGVEVTDLLETADYPMPEGWDAALSYAVDSLAALPRSKISVSADRVDIRAASESEQERARLQSELARAAPDGLTAAVTITAPRPVITPFTLRFLIDEDGPRFDVCSADTNSAMQTILTAATKAGFEGKSNCRLGLGVPTTGWGDAAAAGVRALATIGGGSITYSDLDVSLIAPVGTDPTLFAETRDALDAALPDEFALTAVLLEPEIESEEGPPEFIATRSPEGDVQMRGHLGDTLALAAVETYAKSRFGAANALLAPEDHSALPDGWSLRTLAGLAALSELANGTVTVSSDAITVRGVSGNQEARTRISEIFSTELGDGQAYSLDVSYDERLDPFANIPTPEKCLEDIQAITDVKKLTFEPGSTDLDAESLQAVTSIAAVLRSCPEFELIIEGHTDSQGRETMNLSLSQERAEAVVAALRAERVAWLTIEPRGFGEAEPIASNETEDGREANRRIEFTLVSADDGETVEAQETADE